MSRASKHNSRDLPTSRSLENIYEKIRDLKSEFQHVEEKMRSAVEALNYPDKMSGDISRDDSGLCTDSSQASSSSGYYPGRFTEKMMKKQQEEMSSGVSTPTYPFSPSSCSSPHTLQHSETYVQIPVDRAHLREKRPVWNIEVDRWKLSWQKNGRKAETIEYRATISEYM